MVEESHAVTADQRARERSIEFALALDVLIIAAYSMLAVVAGSLTMLAELLRGVLMTVIEFFALAVMRRIHRRRTAMFEFGSGRLEQFVNVAIAMGMLGGAVWIAFGALGRLAGEGHAGTPAGFALAAIVAAFNLYVNVLAWDGMRRAARGGGSLIMQGQLRARIVKLASSACVQLSLTVAALSSDGVVIGWADSVGALLVCGFIVHAAAGMLRSDLPDLVDRAVNEDVQAAINRMLIRHFDDYERLDLVRTRRSGAVVHAEITLGFRSDLTLADVTRRIEAMKASLREEVGEADIAIVAVGC
jgi:divalent metal cation (Fe/Co/Zn/Cd) transporter